MVSKPDVLLRVKAFTSLAPVPRGETLRFAAVPAKHRACLSVVRMGGEALPWGLLWKVGSGAAEFFGVPDPRKSTELALEMRRFGRSLKAFLESTSEANPKPLQIWIPHSSHLEILHNLAFRFEFVNGQNLDVEAPEVHAAELRELAGMCAFLAHEETIPGQQLVQCAAAVLNEHFVFPADPIRSAHLGLQLAWIESGGVVPEKRWKLAEQAERESVSSSLAPEVEKKKLVAPVEVWGDSNASVAARTRAKTDILAVVRSELSRRLELVEKTLAILGGDKRRENSGASALMEDSLKRLWEERANAAKASDFLHVSPKTDRVYWMANKRFEELEAANTTAFRAFLLDDAFLRDAAIDLGEVAQLRVVKITETKQGRSRTVHWICRQSLARPFKMKVGDKVEWLEREGKELRILQSEVVGHELELTLDVPPGAARDGFDFKEKKHRGRVILLVRKAGGGFRRPGAPDKEKPGGWLVEYLKNKLREESPADEGDDRGVA